MSKISYRKYIYRLIVFSVVIAFSGVIFQWLAPQYASVAIPFIVVFFFLITLFTLHIVLRSTNKSAEKKIIAGYLLSRIIKMFSTLIFLVLYIIFNVEDRWKFVGAFLVIYFLYSFFEIIALKKEQ